MSTLWQLRLAQNDDITALSAFLAASTLELSDPSEHHPDDQWLVAVPIAATAMPSVAMGCIRIRRNIGLAQPRYWYHVGCVVHAADPTQSAPWPQGGGTTAECRTICPGTDCLWLHPPERTLHCCAHCCCYCCRPLLLLYSAAAAAAAPACCATASPAK